MTVLVIGAGGRLGSRVAAALRDDGVAVRAASRDVSRLEDLAARGAEVVTCDLRDRASVDAAVDGASVVVHAAHALAPPVRGNTPAAVDGDGVAALIDAAARAGVERFVLSSVVGARADHPLDFWRYKWEAEQRLRRVGLPHTVLRMAAFAEFHLFTMLGEPIRARRRVTLTGPGTALRNYLSVDDAAGVAVDAVLGRGPALEADVLTVAGPENVTELDAVALLERALGVAARRRHVPAGLVGMAWRPIGWVHPGIGRLLHLAALIASHGDAVDLTPRPGLVVAKRSLQDMVGSWAGAVTRGSS